MEHQDYFVATLSHLTREHRYVTFWRPNAQGYAWPLPWAARCPRDQLVALLDYYNSGCEAIAVPCAA